MMLKTSSNKKVSPAWQLFGFSLRRNSGLLILACIGMLLLSPGWILFSLDGINMTDPDNYFFLMGQFEMIEAAVFGVCSILAVIINFLNFSYLYSKRAGDVFHAVPLTRNEMFITRFFSGYVFSAIPALLGFIGLIGLTAIPRMSHYLPTVLWALVYTLIILFVFSALSTVFIVCAGSVVDAVLSMGGICGGTVILGLIADDFCDRFLTGYVTGAETAILRYCSPIVYCGFGFGELLDESVSFGWHNILFLVKAAVLGAVFFVGSLLLYKYRKSESAGNSYAYRFTYVITSLIASAIGAYCLGCIFGSSPNHAQFWIFAIIGAGLTGVVFGVISYRGFKTIRSSLILSGISFVSLIMLTVILLCGGFGFTARLPEASQIESATIYFCNIEYTETKDFTDILNLHENIIQNRDELQLEGGENSTFLNMDYHLKDGSVLRREFYLNTDVYGENLLRFYRSETALKNIADAVKTVPDTVDDEIRATVFLDDTTGNELDRFPTGYGAFTVEQTEKLCQIYLEEREHATVDSITGKHLCVELSWTCKTGENDYQDHWATFFIESGYTETLETLREIFAENADSIQFDSDRVIYK